MEMLYFAGLVFSYFELEMVIGKYENTKKHSN